MKKLASTSRQRKKQATTTNMVNVKQVESRNTGGRVVRRTVQNRSRSCESAVESSDSVQDEEETVATSNLSNEMLKSRESTTDAGAPPRSSRDQSDSSLTLSLPKEIRTSWLDHDRSSKSEMDAAATAALRRALLPGEAQMQRTHTQETRSTAKSIFSTNKSVVLETQRNSISALPGGHAPLPLPACRPPDYPPEVSTETSEFSDVHQYQSLDGSFNSHSDKEFRSVSSKPAAPLGSDTSLVSLPATTAWARAGSDSSVGTKPFVVSSRIDVNSAESRDAVARPRVAGEMDVLRDGWFSQAQQEIWQPSVSASFDTTIPQTCATDLPSAMSIESHRFWSADVLPAISSSMSAATGLESDESGATARDDGLHQLKGWPSVHAGRLYSHDGNPLLQSSSFKSAVSSAASEHDTAASLQNIPGKMADLFKAFATPALEGYEATSASSITFPVQREQIDTTTTTYESKLEQVRSSRIISTATVKQVLPEHALGVSASALLVSAGATGAAPSVPHGGQPARKFSLRESTDAASKDKPALNAMPSAIASHEQQRTAAALTEPGMTAPKPSVQRPIKQHAASYTGVGATPHGMPSAKRPKKGTESDTTTLAMKSKSQREAPPGVTVVAGATKAAPSSLEQPPKSFAGVSATAGKHAIGVPHHELQTASHGRGGTLPLTAEHGKRGKRETGIPATASGRASSKVVPGERRKHPSAGKVPGGTVFPKGEARRKRSSQSATTSGAATSKVFAEGRAEHLPTRRTASGTSLPKVAAGTQQPVPAMPDWKGVAMSAQPPLAPIDERLERSTTSFSISEAAVPRPPAHIFPAAADRDGRTENALTTTTGAKTENAAAAPAVAALTEATPSAKVQADHLAVTTAVPGVDQIPTRPDTIGIELAKFEGSADVGPAHLAPIEEQSGSLAADANVASVRPSTLNQQMTKKHPGSESTELSPGIVAEHQITQTVAHSFSTAPLTKKGPDKEREMGASATLISDAVITQNIEPLAPESSDIDVGLLPEVYQENLPATAPESEFASFVDADKQVVKRPHEAATQDGRSAIANSELKHSDRLADKKQTQKKELGEIMQALEPAEKLPSLEYIAVAQLEDQQKTRYAGLGATSQDPEQAEELIALEHKDLESKEDGARDHENVLKDSETPIELEQLALSKKPKEEQVMQRVEFGEIVQDEEQSEKLQQLKQSELTKKEGGGQGRKDAAEAAKTPLQLEQLALSKQPDKQQAMLREELAEILRDEQSEKPQHLKQPDLTKKKGGGKDRKDAVKAEETPLELEQLALSKQPKEEQVMNREEFGEIVQDEKQSGKPQQLKRPELTKKVGGGQRREYRRKVQTLDRSQELLDNARTVVPKLPTGELVEALLEVPVDASAEDSRMSLEQTIDSTRRGVGDDQAERMTDLLVPFPDKAVNSDKAERVRASASTPVSKHGKEPAFLFEESLRRATVSSSWAETSIQEEVRRRSSSVGSPRAALTVSTTPSDDLPLATDHGDKVQTEQRRRISTPGTGRPGTITSSARTDEAALLAGGARDFAEPTSKGQQKSSEDLSDSLTADGSTTVTCKGPGLDFHGDTSRKSEETTGESRIAQEHITRALAGVFADVHDRQVAGPGSEDTASEHAVTMSDSRGFQPSIGEVLAQHPRQGPSGAQEGADAAAAAAGKKNEERPSFHLYATKPHKKIDIEGTASVDSDAIDEEAELTRDLYPFLAPDEELQVAVSAMSLPSEQHERAFEFEQSVGGKSTFREDQSSTTFLPVSSEEVRQGRGVGQRGSAAHSESLREGSEGQDREERTCAALSGSDLGKSSPAEIVYVGSPPHVRGLPCTALVELPTEQQIVVAPSREILEQKFWESEGGLSPGNSSITLDDSPPPSRSTLLRSAAARMFQAPPPLRGVFPAQDPVPLNLPALPQPTPPQLPVELKASDEGVSKAKKLKALSKRMASTVRSTLDSAAPVIALSFALFAFMTAAAILLSRENDDVYQL